MLQFTFLGTSSGVPSLTRNVSGLAVRYGRGKDWILIDAGEGTQHQIQRAKLSLQSLKAICITHVHGDHCYGLMGLLASAGMNARKDLLTIIAPKNIQLWFEATQQLTDLHLPYPVQFIDVARENLNFSINPQLQIQPYCLSHRVESFAFAITATQQQKKLNVECLARLNVPKGQLWGELQQGKDIQHHGQVIHSKDVLDLSTQTVKAIISGDNDQPELLSDACKDADVLIHESTYTQATLDKVGSAPMHSSAKMVAEFAESVQLPNLILTHFSARYHDASGMALIEQEAKQFYHGHLILAEDLKTYALKESGQISEPL